MKVIQLMGSPVNGLWSFALPGHGGSVKPTLAAVYEQSQVEKEPYLTNLATHFYTKIHDHDSKKEFQIVFYV